MSENRSSKSSKSSIKRREHPTEDDRVIVKQEKVDDYPEPPSPGPVGLSSPVLSRPEDMGV
ncbi:uncharacterized protein EHS24_003961 [Apiotrichum porosum]|uniref:Uncharacterized protein n=1 Tax=Apiotrichum porosum TaxID=105984 RepID=A0A427XDM3_9TREE|nr:uncharacterized protein EHS24_003961 [Apiotrichum porosum]RSH77020.1 hypothetical protein EHS24_003961 [Apiotrichum porosum]